MQSFGSTSEMNQRDTVLFFLAIAGIAWYIALWCIGLLGCYAAYDSSFPSEPSFFDFFPADVDGIGCTHNLPLPLG